MGSVMGSVNFNHQYVKMSWTSHFSSLKFHMTDLMTVSMTNQKLDHNGQGPRLGYCEPGHGGYIHVHRSRSTTPRSTMSMSTKSISTTSKLHHVHVHGVCVHHVHVHGVHVRHVQVVGVFLCFFVVFFGGGGWERCRWRGRRWNGGGCVASGGRKKMELISKRSSRT